MKAGDSMLSTGWYLATENIQIYQAGAKTWCQSMSQMRQIWDFLRSVSVHFGALRQNVLKLILKSPRLVPIEDNLTQFGDILDVLGKSGRFISQVSKLLEKCLLPGLHHDVTIVNKLPSEGVTCHVIWSMTSLYLLRYHVIKDRLSGLCVWGFF